jgi:hypothetical protein
MPAILPDITATEAFVIEITNRVRQREQLEAVQQDKALTIAARAFALYLAKTDTFSHTADGRQPAMRARAAGYKYCQVGENLALSASALGFEAKALATDTVAGWLKSPTHRANLLAPYVTDIGVAVEKVADKKPKYVVVEMVGRPQALSTEFQISNLTTETVRYSLSGAVRTIDPGTAVPHSVCDPKVLEFLSAGSTAISGQYAAENGKVYTVSQKADAITIKVKARDKEK